MIEKIVDVIGADLGDETVSAFFNGLKGLNSSNAHIAADPLLSLINSRPESFVVSDPDKARTVINELLGVSPKVTAGGVGTELAKLIPDWAIQFKDGCGCKDMQRLMDKWGPDGCDIRRGRIVAHLMGQSEHLIPAFKLVPDAMKKIVAERLLNKAIKRARDAA